MENNTKTKYVYLATGIIAYLAFLIYYLNGSYPWVGHDYHYFISHLLDSYIHYLQNGFSIQWFTPSFGGSLPAYFNPTQIQFSLAQLLIFFMNPWLSILVSSAFYATVGYLGAYKFSREVLDLDWEPAVLGALFFMISGFSIQHIAAGAFSYSTFPLLSPILYFLFCRKYPTWFNGFSIGLLITIIINNAGFYLLIIVALTVLIFTPLFYLLVPKNFVFKRIALSAGIGGMVALLLSVSKLFAIYSFFQHFPRDLYSNHEFFSSIYNSYFSALLGFGLQFTGIPILTLPIRVLIEDPLAVVNMMTNLVNGRYIWETDTSIAPLLLLILIKQLNKGFKKITASVRKHGWRFNLAKDKLTAGIFLGLAAWFIFEFTAKYGILYNLVRNLPIIRSFNFNGRFGGSLLFPLAILGAFILNSDLKHLSAPKRKRTFLMYFSITLAFLGIYFLLPFSIQYRSYDLRQAMDTYSAIRAGEAMYVDKISPVTDSETFLEHASSQIPYEPIFGYWQEQFFAKVTKGPIEMTDGQYYNMTNPYSLVYGTDELWTRFTLDEREEMLQFASYQQPDWDIPPIQHTLNAISLVSLIVVILLSGGHLIREKLKKKKQA